MLKDLLQKIQRLSSGGRGLFDPSVFNDPLALQTEWTPAKGGGANFRTHKLVEIHADRLEFKASVIARLFYLTFFLAGLGILIGFLAPLFSAKTSSFDFELIIPLIVGFVFTSLGAFMLYFGTQPVVFDRRNGFFWKGRTAPDEVLRQERLKNFAKIDQVHAIQLLSEYCRGNKSSYYSYEINLVLKDGGRINVVDHGNAAKIRQDAEKIADFIKKPVWDAI
jgi:hypothetical protein